MGCGGGAGQGSPPSTVSLSLRYGPPPSFLSASLALVCHLSSASETQALSLCNALVTCPCSMLVWPRESHCSSWEDRFALTVNDSMAVGVFLKSWNGSWKANEPSANNPGSSKLFPLLQNKVIFLVKAS